MRLLQKLILQNASDLKLDFDMSSELYPFWANYPPEQRGRKPKGDSIPWIEVGETSLTANMIRLIAESQEFGTVMFPGLPSGGDMRFATQDAFIHIDVKVTGPRDATDEVVASRNQVSGDGVSWNPKGPLNSIPRIRGQPFRPELPPFYLLHDKTLLCLIYFLKAVYRIEKPGLQPLSYLELVSLPNGLLLFGGPRYCERYPDLLSQGKNDRSVAIEKRRKRVNLDPLSRIDAWRCVQFWPDSTGKNWKMVERLQPTIVLNTTLTRLRISN
jgi:hypothetical protein